MSWRGAYRKFSDSGTPQIAGNGTFWGFQGFSKHAKMWDIMLWTLKKHKDIKENLQYLPIHLLTLQILFCSLSLCIKDLPRASAYIPWLTWTNWTFSNLHCPAMKVTLCPGLQCKPRCNKMKKRQDGEIKGRGGVNGEKDYSVGNQSLILTG